VILDCLGRPCPVPILELAKAFGTLTVGETIKSWSVMETVISVFGFVLVYLLSLVV